MVEEQKKSVFRKKTLDRMASTEQLTDYLKVANPGVWITVVAVIVLLAGIFEWSFFSRLETSAQANVIVENNMGRVMPLGSESFESGMTLKVEGKEAEITSTETDEYGRTYGIAELILPDGVYSGTVVTQSIDPVEFLLTGR